ncbi:MAG: PQQ-binding-like beta-propeller repeat protein [Anaerolineaceae bacterium]|nr:MAG: PQQ-binding-like beta-propeller repeat protein [Anaerolineaceae bacterium]
MSTLPHPTRRSILLLGLILISSVLLAGCGGGSMLSAASWPGLSIDDTNAYLAYGPTVYAIDLTTNRENWHYPSEPIRNASFYASPAPYEGGLVIVGGYDSMVYALDPTMGGDVRSAWIFEGASANIIGAPVVAGDIVLVPSADNNLYALDLATGDPVWTQPFTTEEALWSAPLVEEDVIYLASLDHRVYAIDLPTGRELWKTEPLNGAIADTPTLAGDLVLVGTFNSQVVAVDTERRGAIAWSFDTSGWIWGSPAVADDLAFFGDYLGLAYAVDINNGQEVWRVTLDGPVTTTPAYKDGVVFFVTEAGTVYAFETDSAKPFWTSNPVLNGRLLSDPVLSGDTLLVATMDNPCVISAVETETSAVRCLLQFEE